MRMRIQFEYNSTVYNNGMANGLLYVNRFGGRARHKHFSSMCENAFKMQIVKLNESVKCYPFGFNSFANRMRWLLHGVYQGAQ